MISDEERREAAKKLRDSATSQKENLQDDPDYSPFSALDVVSDLFGRFPRHNDLMHLADLIDRPTCEMEPDKVHCDYVCRACGQHYQYPETYDGNGYPVPFKYCPHCGAEVTR